MHYPLEWVDITIDGEDTLQEFTWEFNKADGINQDGRIVASVCSIMDVAILKEMRNAVADALGYTDHYYTDEEWDYINGIFDRYITLMGYTEGLISMLEEPEAAYDLMGALADYKIDYINHICRYYKPDVFHYQDDPATNIPHMLLDWHLTQSIANLMGNPRPFHYGGSAACRRSASRPVIR